MHFDNLICPLDGLRLNAHDRSLRCDNGHSFDVAKQGYINLLPVQHKRSKDPGDSKAMVAARQRFLAQGCYQPLADALVDVALQKDTLSLLDAGCGEGYYSRYLFQLAKPRQVSINLVGLDISKWAVQAAARQTPEGTWLVASNTTIPLADNSVDVILCVFGFPVEKEFMRVLKPSGCLIMVDPAGDHLIELKQLIYPDVKTKVERLPISSSRWTLQSEQRVSFAVDLTNNAAINDLLMMTPHLYRSSKVGREHVEGLNRLQLTADIWLRVFKKGSAV